MKVSNTLTNSLNIPHLARTTLFLTFLLVASSCKEDVSSSPDFSAAYAAKQYYDSLFFAGNAAYFVDARYQQDSIPSQYRKNLITATQQYVSEMQNINGQIDSITVQDCLPDSALNCTHTTLRLHFKSGKKETILVPMVKKGERWLMK